MCLCEYAHTHTPPFWNSLPVHSLWWHEFSLLRAQVQSSVRELRKMNMSLQSVTNYDRHTLVYVVTLAYLRAEGSSQAINL